MGFGTSADTDIIYTEAPTSTVYYEEGADVETYTTLFRRLNVAAVNASQSRKLIVNAIREME